MRTMTPGTRRHSKRGQERHEVAEGRESVETIVWLLYIVYIKFESSVFYNKLPWQLCECELWVKLEFRWCTVEFSD